MNKEVLFTMNTGFRDDYTLKAFRFGKGEKAGSKPHRYTERENFNRLRFMELGFADFVKNTVFFTA